MRDPHYRRNVLTGKIADGLHNRLRKKAKDLEITIEALEIMPDHVHLFVSADPTDAPQRLANQFKGFTSRVLRQKYPELSSRLPSLWNRGYFIGSEGQVSEKNNQALHRKTEEVLSVDSHL